MFVPVLSTEVRGQRRADYDNLIPKKRPWPSTDFIILKTSKIRNAFCFVLS